MKRNVCDRNRQGSNLQCLMKHSHSKTLVMVYCFVRLCFSPISAVVTSPEPPKHTCHCSNCLNHECATKFGCIVDVDLTTNTSTQDCLRSSTGKQIHCSPSFALSTSHALAREVGKIKSYCCQGDKCNSIHPDHPHGKCLAVYMQWGYPGQIYRQVVAILPAVYQDISSEIYDYI